MKRSGARGSRAISVVYGGRGGSKGGKVKEINKSIMVNSRKDRDTEYTKHLLLN